MEERIQQQSLEMDSKLNESKSFQDNIYRKFMEQTSLMLEQNIKISTSFTKEKINELMKYLKIEKVEYLEIIKLLGLTHSLLYLTPLNPPLFNPYLSLLYRIYDASRIC